MRTTETARRCEARRVCACFAQTVAVDLIVAFDSVDGDGGEQPHEQVHPAVREVGRLGSDIADPVGAQRPAFVVADQLDPEAPRAPFNRAREELRHREGEVLHLLGRHAKIVGHGRHERAQGDSHPWVRRNVYGGGAHPATLS